ncbi:hypothetical protein BJ138DRAFT_1098879 [Hygrophoropsis aurantiaca]|uniref:Uncharacterized protein n=1 Tax=Hygrophoropsis aurantiaca TaxID=72124 RepID=A0ACB8ALV4_9AGAM|nr:hypothetical protein BJ138DRAFT_1098879 [Hygrophoropsis aurantiaca]
MDLPSPREIELETALRKRDTQVLELTRELTRLRQHLASYPDPDAADPVTLPPALVSVLLPHISKAASSAEGTASSSSTVNAALTQRVRLLQEENDELFGLLKHGETGRLKEEVRGLRRVVGRLEGALRESHQVISSLSTELEKSYESFQLSARHKNVNSHQHSQPYRDNYHPPQSTSNGTSKPPPTAPRAHKKPRLSDPKVSPARSNISLPTSKPPPTSMRQSMPKERQRSRSPRLSPSDTRAKSSNIKMEVDEDARTRPRSPAMERDRGERHRAKDRVRERDRDRDRDRSSRRGGGGGGERRSRGFAGHQYGSADRTLAERMGL